MSRRALTLGGAIPAWLTAAGVLAIAAIAGQIAAHLGLTGGLGDAATELLDVPVLLFVLAATLFARSKTTITGRLVWGLFALGFLAWLVADLIFDFREFVLGAGTNASVADLFWLLYYPPLLAALYLRSRADGPDGRNMSFIDSLIITLAAGLLLWKFLLEGSISAGGDPITQIVSIAYPAFDLGLIWLLIRPAFQRNVCWTLPRVLLVLGFVGIFVADVIWLKTQTSLYGLMTSVCLLPVAAAAVVSVRTRAAEQVNRRATITAWPMFIVVIIGLAPLLARLLGGTHDPEIEIGAAAILLLLMVRLALTVTQNERLLSESEQLASTDPLTHLNNRRYFSERLEQELEQSRRRQDPVALLLIDIDEFKSINDLAGHRAGDRVLTEIAQKLRSVCRRTDICCRIGGDELAVIAPSTDGSRVMGLAERLRRSIATVQTRELGSSAPASVSIGCCVFPDLAASEIELVERADAALYHVKQSGRNASAMYDPSANDPMTVEQDLERVQTQLASKQSDFRAVFEHALDPMVITDDGVILSTNAAGAELAGVSREQLVGLSLGDFAKPGEQSMFGAIVSRARDRGETRGEIELAMPDGTKHVMDYSAARFSRGRYLTSLRDVTARVNAQAALRESEARFRAIFDNALDAMMIIDDAGVIHDVNPAAIRLMNRSRPELIGSSLESLVDPERMADITDRRRKLERDQTQIGRYRGILGGNEHIRTVEYSAVANITPGRHLSIMRDVTDFVENGDDEFHRGASELQTPLNVQVNGHRARR